jgi:hypothetical protein
MDYLKRANTSQGARDPRKTIDDILKKGRPILPPMRPQTVKSEPRKETVTTIKHISKSTPVEVTPSEIIINDIEINQTYEVVVLVRNLTSIGRRIRIYQPKTNKFRCDYDMQGNVAPGCAMKLIVTFETATLGDFHDFLEIVSDIDGEKFKYTLPLHAYQPQANIVFEPFINFGFCRLNHEKIEKIAFTNEGKL